MPFHRRRPGLIDPDEANWWQTTQDFAGEAADYITDYPGRYLMQLGQYGASRPSTLMESGEALSVWNPLGPALGDITKLGAPGLKELVNKGLWGDWQIDLPQAENIMRAIVAMTPTAGRIGPKYFSRAEQTFGKGKFTPQQMMAMANKPSKYPGLKKDLEWSGAWEKLIALPPEQSVTLGDLKYTPIELKHMLADQPKKDVRITHPIGSIPAELRTQAEQTEFDNWIRETPDIRIANIRKDATTEEYLAQYGDTNSPLGDSPTTFRGGVGDRYLAAHGGEWEARHTGVGEPKGTTRNLFYKDPTGKDRYTQNMSEVIADYNGNVQAAKDALVTGSQLIVNDIDEYKTSAREITESSLEFHKEYGRLAGDKKKISRKEAETVMGERGEGTLSYQARGYHLDRLNSNMQVIEQLGQLLEQGITNYDPVLHPTSWTRVGGTNYREIKVRYDPRSGDVFSSDSMHYGPNILSWGRMHDAHLEFDELPPEFLDDAGYKDIIPEEGYRVYAPVEGAAEVGADYEWRLPTEKEEYTYDEFKSRYTLDTFNLDEAQSKWMQKAAGIRKDELRRLVVTRYIKNNMRGSLGMTDVDKSTKSKFAALNTVLSDRFKVFQEKTGLQRIEQMILKGTAEVRDIKTYFDIMEDDPRRKGLLVAANKEVPESFAYGNPPMDEVEARQSGVVLNFLTDSQEMYINRVPSGTPSDDIQSLYSWGRKFKSDSQLKPEKPVLEWLDEMTYPDLKKPRMRFKGRTKLTDGQWDKLHNIFGDTTAEEKRSTIRAVNAGMTLEELNLSIVDHVSQLVKAVPDPEIMKGRLEWIEPTLKHMLDIAAKEGYEYISWSSPEVIKDRWRSLDVEGGIADSLYGRKLNEWFQKQLKTKIYKSKDTGVSGKKPLFFMRLTPEKAQEIIDKGFPLTQLRKKELEAYA